MSNKSKSDFDSVTLLLQGGGALGAYQAGVFQALSEAEMEPDWVAGISIGAINAAVIAGNAPKDRVAKLRQFWETVTFDAFQYVSPIFKGLLTRDNSEHQLLNTASALRTIFLGVPGFFAPRMLSPWLEPKHSVAATSFYNTAPLKAMLEELIDFDRLNHDNIRLTLGAVNVTSGNFTSFDNKEGAINADHIMASGALPPGFPPVAIGDEYYWDGGLVSNTPLEWLLDGRLLRDMLVFQVDLWSADGPFPATIAEVFTRQKDIQYSSRTPANTDKFKERYKMHHAIAQMLEKLPDNLKQTREAKALKEYAGTTAFNIVHLIYHNKAYEGYSKDFEFSRLSMEAHWQSGYADTMKALKHPEIRRRSPQCVGVFDFNRKESGPKESSAA